MEREIAVTVDGKEIPMNSFVQTMMVNMITAMIRSLKGADPAAEIEIRLEKESGQG